MKCSTLQEVVPCRNIAGSKLTLMYDKRSSYRYTITMNICKITVVELANIFANELARRVQYHDNKEHAPNESDSVYSVMNVCGGGLIQILFSCLPFSYKERKGREEYNDKGWDTQVRIFLCRVLGSGRFTFMRISGGSSLVCHLIL